MKNYKANNKKRKFSMPYIIIALLIFFLILIPVFNLLVWSFTKSKHDNQNFTLVGHRGSASLAPENTLAAIDSGIAHNVDFVEIDIRQTKDNQLIVMHDRSVNRTTDGNGNVEDLTYEAIKKLNASKALPGYALATTVPSLEEVIQKIAKSHPSLIIEIKDPKLYPGMEKRLVSILENSGCINKLFIFSFDPDVVFQVKKDLPQIKTGLFCIGIEKLKYASQVDYLCPNWISVLYFPNLINDIHKRGAKSFVWTMNNTSFKKYIIDKNANGIITNNPVVIKPN